MNLPPWSPELHYVSPVPRDTRDPSQAQPAEPTVVQPSDENFFAVRVEIFSSDRRRVVSAPPVYVAPVTARSAASALQLPAAHLPPQLPAGGRTDQAVPSEHSASDRAMLRSSAHYGVDAQRALAAYDAQLQLSRQYSSENLGSHVRVRA
jgi:hypothetical protein